MIVYLQWALETPQEWQAYDITSNAVIQALPKKPEPVGGEVLDNNPGWLCAANVQGVGLSGWDHIGIEHEILNGEDLLKVSCWNNDPDDWPVGERWGVVWTFLPVAPDQNIGGGMNSRQSSAWYADPTSENGLRWSDLGVEYQHFDSFLLPDSQNTFHGIWIDDSKWEQFMSLQTRHVWGEWVPE